MSLYTELSTVELLDQIQGKYKVDFDSNGNPKIYLKPTLEFNSVWLSTLAVPDRLCDLWRIYFYSYNIIPIGCRSCFKVVMDIPTLKDLFKVLDYQRSHKDNAKCGVEKRPYTGKIGSYAGVWYGPLTEGLAGGRDLWKRISRDFPSHNVILKRGCTEFEMTYSPSDTWDELAENGQWDTKERLLDTLFVPDPLTNMIESNTPAMLEVHTIKRWIEWAFEHGDKTYLEFVDKPFKFELMQYHKSIHKNEDFVCKDLELIKRKVSYDNRRETEGIRIDRLDGSANEDSGISTERNSALIQGLPDS